MPLISKEVFGQIRKILPFRMTGNKKDYIIVGSDSGRIVILEVNIDKREFVKIHQETFGKTGVRRIVPGEYIAADPKGRAIMIGAVEKQKFVYIISRDNENRMTISSPLEAHKNHSICFDLVGLDVGYENPMFACLEVDYGESDDENAPVNSGVYQKLLVYYEMDLGLNHVVRKDFEKVDNSAHLLKAIPSGPDGPGGVVVFCEDYLIYKKQSHEDRVTPYPKRHESINSCGLMISSCLIFKRKEIFSLIAQSEAGDIYRVSINYTNDKVHGVQIQYFDTIPVSNSLCVFVSGLIFSASETSNHYLYNIIDLGEKEEISTYSTMDVKEPVLFNPRALKNLDLVDELPSLSCITDMQIDDLYQDGSPQIYTLCGRGTRSTLRILKYGLSVNEMASSPLNGVPLAIWTLKGNVNDKLDKYIVVSMQSTTIVLEIGQNVKEVLTSGLKLNKPSIHVGLLADNTYIQVTPTGIIHIKSDTKSDLYKLSSKIIAATSNPKQIAVALVEKEIIYFELEEGNRLTQVEKKVVDSEILSITVGAVPEGRTRSKFLAVGCADNFVRILSLDIGQYLGKVSMQSLPSAPTSVLLREIGGVHTEERQLYLFVGLNNGVLMKTSMDSVTGSLSDIRTKYLGNRAVSLFEVSTEGAPAVLANSSKPWLCYTHMGTYQSNKLNYESVDHASSFSSETCEEGIVCISGTNLKIFNVERLGTVFNETVIPLRYTPRKLSIHPETNNLVIIESEQNIMSKKEKDNVKQEISERTKDPDYLSLNEDQIGFNFLQEGRWGSCIRMLEPYENKLVDLIEFEENEAALSSCIMTFSSTPGEMFLIVGTAKDLRLHPRSFSSASLVVFAFKDQGQKIEYKHRTPVEEIPLGFSEFQGRLVAGVGNLVRIYDLGKNRLLKKCETKKLTSIVIGINTYGQRIFVNTMNESFHVLRYKPNENQLYLFADDMIPRWLNCSCILDYDTIAGCDKFENFFVYRLPSGCDEESEEDPMGTKYKWELGFLHGAAFKLSLLAQFHRGDLITSIKKCSLSGGSQDLIVYSTTSGAIGVFMPFETREDVDFFVHLEMYLKLEVSPLSGRDHQMYRSAYGPVKCVIDGDLCEEFSSMDLQKQKLLSTELDKTPTEITKKLEELRNKII